MAPGKTGGAAGVPAAGTIAGNYRLLKDIGTITAPVAVTAGFGETDASHPAYGQNMGEWCAACHGQYINDNHKHKASNSDTLNGEATNYNAYVSTGDYTGVQATSFLQFVQFERQETDKALILCRHGSAGLPPPVASIPDFLCLLAGDRAYVKDVFRLETELGLKNLEKLRAALGEDIDIIGFDGFDFGLKVTIFPSGVRRLEMDEEEIVFGILVV